MGTVPVTGPMIIAIVMIIIFLIGLVHVLRWTIKLLDWFCHAWEKMRSSCDDS